MHTNGFYISNEFYVNSLDFHGTRDLLLAATISGGLVLYNLNKEGSELQESWSNQTAHTKSIRKATFSKNGRDVIAVAADKRVSLLDVEGSTVKWYGRGHRAGISTFCILDNNTIATGDDDGEIRVWDTRLAKAACRSKVSEFGDSVNAMLLGKESKELLALCDDQLGCFDLKNGKVSLQGMSDNVEDEMQCMTYAKGTRKVVCGSNTGHLCIFSYGRWGDLDDRMTVHANSVETVVAFDEDTVLVGGDDGKVHVVSIHPNSALGTIDSIHRLGLDISSTDSLCINRDKSHLAFVANLENICIVPTDVVSALIEGEELESGFFGDL